MSRKVNQKNEDLKQKVLNAAADQGINTILFRNAMAKKLDLSLTESLCLTLLGINLASTPSELAKHIGLSTGSTTTLLDRLEKKKFIKRKSNPNDRRGVIIEIDKEFSKAAFPLVEGIQKLHHKLIAEYSDTELEVIADFLGKFVKNLVSETKRIEE